MSLKLKSTRNLSGPTVIVIGGEGSTCLSDDKASGQASRQASTWTVTLLCDI